MGKFKKSLPKVGRPASREHDHSAVTIRRAASLVLGFDVELFDRRPDRTGRGLSRYRRLWSKSSPDHGEDDRFRSALLPMRSAPRWPSLVSQTMPHSPSSQATTCTLAIVRMSMVNGTDVTPTIADTLNDYRCGLVPQNGRLNQHARCAPLGGRR